jgi:hypothetical protein
LIVGADKYKPQSIKHLVGQQGDKSPVQKLIVWLRDWYKNHAHSDEKVKAKPSFGFNRNENPAMFKAALLSGPPGIGETPSRSMTFFIECSSFLSFRQNHCCSTGLQTSEFRIYRKECFGSTFQKVDVDALE